MPTVLTDGPTMLAYRIVLSSQTEDWHVVDPVGGAICRADTQARAEQIARAMAGLRAERDVRAEC
jgi:hypothetical protein